MTEKQEDRSIISIRHLRKEYPNVIPLRDVSVEIKKRRSDFHYRPVRHRKINPAALYQPSGDAHRRRDRGGRRDDHG